MKFYIVILSLVVGLCSIHTAEAAGKSTLKKKVSKIKVLRSKKKQKQRKTLAKKRALLSRNEIFSRRAASENIQTFEPETAQEEELNISAVVCDNHSDTREVENVVRVSRIELTFPDYITRYRSDADIEAEASAQGCQQSTSDIVGICESHGCSSFIISGASCSLDNLGSNIFFANYVGRTRVSFYCR